MLRLLSGLIPPLCIVACWVSNAEAISFELEWASTLGTTGTDGAYSIAMNEKGDVFLGGVTGGVLGDESIGRTDAFLAKFDSEGRSQWIDQYGGLLDDRIGKLTIGRDGGVFAQAFLTSESVRNAVRTSTWKHYADDGRVVGKVDLSGAGPVAGAWIDDAGNLGTVANVVGDVDFLEVRSVEPSTSGDSVYLAGVGRGRQLVGVGDDYDALVTKVGLDGTVEWSGALGTQSYDQVSDIAVDPLGNVYLVGFENEAALDPNGAAGAFVAKINGDGELLWSRHFGSDGSWAGSVAVDARGNVFVGGWAGDFTRSTPEAFLAVFGNDGKLRGSIGLDRQFLLVHDLAVDHHNYVYVAGDSGTSLSHRDAEVAKFYYVPEPATIATGVVLLVLVALTFRRTPLPMGS